MYHFKPPGFCHLVTAVYPSITKEGDMIDDEELSKLNVPFFVGLFVFRDVMSQQLRTVNARLLDTSLLGTSHYYRQELKSGE